MIKFRILWWGDDPRLFRWAQRNHSRISVRRDAMIEAEAGVYGNLLQHQEMNTASKKKFLKEACAKMFMAHCLKLKKIDNFKCLSLGND